MIKCLAAKSGEISKPWDTCYEWSDRSEIWHVPRWLWCRDLCQILERCNHSKTWSHDFEISQDLAVKRFTTQWLGALQQRHFQRFRCQVRWSLNTPRQNGRHFADDILKCIFLNENIWISMKISLKFVPKGHIKDIPALVWKITWRRPGDKPLSEAMVVSLLTHICVARPQWYKSIYRWSGNIHDESEK